eukprot:PhM_4_TR15884/c0_g1_i2/m.17070
MTKSDNIKTFVVNVSMAPCPVGRKKPAVSASQISLDPREASILRAADSHGDEYGHGRKKYLKHRAKASPADRFQRPMTSSQIVGWFANGAAIRRMHDHEILNAPPPVPGCRRHRPVPKPATAVQHSDATSGITFVLEDERGDSSSLLSQMNRRAAATYAVLGSMPDSYAPPHRIAARRRGLAAEMERKRGVAQFFNGWE